MLDSQRTSTASRSHLKLTLCICSAAVLIPFVWLFGKALWEDQLFVYRDAAHFYFPLLRLVADEWGAGRVPLWNSQENLGQPLLGNSVAGVFYPGQLLFALPLDYATSYKLYIVLHLLLAAATSYGCARGWRHSRLAATLCAVSYAFSGSVLIQTSNIPFLIGAAWLPAGLWATDRLLRGKQASGVFTLASVLALMTLGGDPQAAYHVVLLAALYSLLLWIRRRPARHTSAQAANSSVQHSVGWRRLVRSSSLVRLAAAAILAGLLAAVQIFPAAQWTRHSDRASYVQPRSLYEVAAFAARREACEDGGTKKAKIRDGLLARAQPGTHQAHMYQFSVGPWRLVEFIWPNSSGRQYPVHRRWLNVIPAEGRVWSPSLYMGLLPLVLAVSSWRLRKGTIRTRWLSWIMILSILGSFGWYGIGWIAFEVLAVPNALADVELPVGKPFGGLYWLMSLLLPGYVYFRYPAKLLIPATLGISLLAARGWDRATQRPATTRRLLAVIVSASVVGICAALVVRPQWKVWLSDRVAPDQLFGPLDTSGAFDDLWRAFVHTTIVASMMWCLWRWASRGNERTWRTRVPNVQGPSTPFSTAATHWWTAAMILLTSIELAAAQKWMIQSAPTQLWREPSLVARLIADEDSRRGVRGPYRIYRATLYQSFPSSWRQTSSPDRQREGLRWDRDTLFPKYHLSAGLSQVEVLGTMASSEYRSFLKASRHPPDQASPKSRRPVQQVFSGLGVKYLLLPGGEWPRRFERCVHWPASQLGEISLWYNPDFLPRVWTVPNAGIEFQPALSSVDRQMTAIIWNGQVPVAGRAVRDFATSAMVEHAPVDIDLSRARDATDSCRIVHDAPQRVEIEAELAGPGLVVLADQYYPGWCLEVSTEGRSGSRQVDVLRTNGVMRGALLPAGRHRLVYRYRPRYFYAGAVLSAITWTALICWLTVWVAIRRR